MDSEGSSVHAGALQMLTQQTSNTFGNNGDGHCQDASRCNNLSARRLTGPKNVHSWCLLLLVILLRSWVASAAAAATGASKTGDMASLNNSLTSLDTSQAPLQDAWSLHSMADPVSRRHILFDESVASGQAGTLVGWGSSSNAGIVRSAPQAAQVPGAVKAVASGYSHILLLLSNGSVTGYGDNRWGQLDIPPSVQSGPVTAIAACAYSSMALLSNGTVGFWGQITFGQYNTTQGAFISISCSDTASGDTVYTQHKNGSWAAWGGDADGWTQTDFSSRSDIVQVVTAAPNDFIVLLKDGTVRNETSVFLPAAAGAKFICSTGDEVLALLGNGTVVPLSGQYTIPNISIASLACGDTYAVANATDGSIVTFEGDSTRPGFAISETTPPLMSTGAFITAMSAGSNHVVYLMSNGVVLQAGELIFETAIVPYTTSDSIISFAAGWMVYVAIQADGKVTAWGDAELVPDIYNIPDLSSYGTIKAITAGDGFALALSQAGSVVQWGTANGSGGLNASVPSAAQFGVSAMCAGKGYALAVRQGRVIGWGDGLTYDACNVSTSIPPAAMANVTMVSCGPWHALALLQNGSVVAWGCNDSSQLSVPSTAVSNVIAVSAGGGGMDRYAFSMALLKSGRVIVWGGVSYVSTVPLAAQQDVIQISAGSYHCLALLRNRTIVAWGYDAGYNETMVPDQYQGRVLAIAAGDSSSFAVLAPPMPPPPQPVPLPPPPPLPFPLTAAPIPRFAPHPLPTSTPQAPNTQHSSGTTKAISKGAIAGIAVAITVAMVATIVLALWLIQLRRRRHQQPFVNLLQDNDSDAYARMVQRMADIPGLAKGEPFTLSTAHNYVWTNPNPNSQYTAIVAGENDHHLDSMAVSGSAGPAVQLTKQQLKEQVQLLRDGLLGRGATALVFKCLWPSRFGSGAVLAAKVLKDGVELSMVALDAFCYEARLLASLDHHNNVVRLYGYCLEPPTVCLIMEVLPFSLKAILYQQPVAMASKGPGTIDRDQEAGQSSINTSSTFASSKSEAGKSNAGTVYLTILGEASSPNTQQTVGQPNDTGNATPRSPLTMQRVLEICIDIAAGLRYLHDTPLAAELEQHTALEAVSELSEPTSSQTDTRTQKIVHRDLKPANILVTASGRAKITDFGLARPHTRTTMSDLNFLAAGTLPYMAPELLVTRHIGGSCFPPTNRIDIYSMGMMMWELLAGCHPWSHMNETAMIAAVLAGGRPFLPTENTHNKEPDGKPRRLSEMPASVEALPELNTIIRACWAQKEHRRLSAKDLHEKLVALYNKYKEGVS